MGLATSYAADCTAQSEQNVAFGRPNNPLRKRSLMILEGWFHGSMFLGMAIGPALGGWISGAAGSPIPVFYISCVSFFPKSYQSAID